MRINGVSGAKGAGKIFLLLKHLVFGYFFGTEGARVAGFWSVGDQSYRGPAESSGKNLW